MSSDLNRRSFLKQSILSSAGGAAALHAAASGAQGAEGPVKSSMIDPVGQGKIGSMTLGRLLLGGNLLTHYTHSRDLKYVYNLAAHYNTESKILETLELAEAYGANALIIHTVPWSLNILRQHRRNGGKMQWIICPTAPIENDMEAYSKGVDEVANMGADSIYVWGVHSDSLVAKGRVDLIAKAVEKAKEYGVPAGVGAHDLRVVVECEKNGVNPDFYIKTFHHHKYPSGPKADEIKGPYNEFPGYWCSDPEAVIKVMSEVKKPWIAFKVMAAGAIPPADAFRYAYENGADHIVAGMFDFEIAEDVRLANAILKDVKRSRPWFS